MNINTHLYDLPVLDAGDYILRAIETSDAPDIYDYARRPVVTRYMLWEAHKSVEDALKFIRFTAELNIDKKNMDWCIVEKSTNRVIGAIGAIVRSPKGEVMELGYVLHPDFWGQGIMPRAARAVRDFIFQNTTCIRLESRHFAENTASGRVMHKIGMTYEGLQRASKQLHGVWTDVCTYSITRDEWLRMQPKDRKQGEERVRKVKCFALDMDGTIYLGDRILPGAFELMSLLKERGIRAMFLTNNSSRSVSTYVERLNRMGFDVTANDIISSGQAAADYLVQTFPGRRVYVMGNDNLKDEMRNFGIRVVEEDAEVVLAGFDTTLDYEKLIRTCDYVRAGLPFVATHPDYNCPTDGGFIPDLGAMLALIRESAGRMPDIIIGKPYEQIARYLMRRTGLEKDELCMVGDRLYTDVATGVNFGMASILVLSGETKLEQVTDSLIQPDLVLRGVDELCEILRG